MDFWLSLNVAGLESLAHSHSGLRHEVTRTRQALDVVGHGSVALVQTDAMSAMLAPTAAAVGPAEFGLHLEGAER